jgi:hypothetical protein
MFDSSKSNSILKDSAESRSIAMDQVRYMKLYLQSKITNVSGMCYILIVKSMSVNMYDNIPTV